MKPSMRHRARKQSDVNAHNRKHLRVLLAVILAVSLFGAGFLVRGNHALMEGFGVDSKELSDPSAVDPDSVVVSMRLNEVEALLSDSVDTYDVRTSTEEAINAFLASTDDKYARYFDAQRYSEYVDANSVQYPGVGVYFSEYNGKAYAVDIFEGSSASDAGVRSGDFVVAIDGDRSQDWSAVEAINAVSGEAGTTVVVTWRRPTSLDSEGGEEFTTTLTRADAVEANVSVELVDEVGYVSLRQITQDSDDLVREAITQLTAQGAKSFVFDIRNNAGGYLTEAVSVASLFIKSGVIVEIDTKDSTTTKQATGDLATEAPLVVLVNENTAGSAEVIAAAMRDSNRATVVGSTTLGRGSVQITTPLSFGGALRYTVARYKSPSGYSIDGVGVVPNVTVANDKTDVDNQKAVAVETAASLVQERP